MKGDGTRYEDMPEHADESMRAMANGTGQASPIIVMSSTSRLGKPALNVRFQQPSGAELRVLYVAMGNRIFMVMTSGAKADDSDRFLNSFEPLR